MAARGWGRRLVLIGLTVALGLCFVVADSLQASADNTCTFTSTRCNVEATNNPLISWPRGFRSTFNNVSGSTATLRVGSITLAHSFTPLYLVEYGWFWWAGRNRAEITRVTDYNNVYNSVPLASIVGIATYTYEIRWFPAQGQLAPAYFLFTAYDSSGAVVPGSQYEDDNPPFNTGTPITNGERHDSSDTFATTLLFTNLLNLSSTPAWSSWSAAMCYLDNDPIYQNYTHPGPYVEVKSGGASC